MVLALQRWQGSCLFASGIPESALPGAYAALVTPACYYTRLAACLRQSQHLHLICAQTSSIQV